MTVVKTTISLESTLLERTDNLAQNTNNSRSGVIAIALQHYFRDLEQQQTLEKLNKVYQDKNNYDSEEANQTLVYFANHVLEEEDW